MDNILIRRTQEAALESALSAACFAAYALIMPTTLA